MLSGCSCLDTGGVATTGYCQSDTDNCDKLLPYLLAIGIASIISSTARTGNSLLTLRYSSLLIYNTMLLL